MDSNDKAYGILAYIGILCLVPIFAGKSEYARFHANQGLILFIIEMISGVAAIILSFVPFLGMILGLVDLACFVFAIIGIVNAAQGEMKELPVIGTIKILK